MRYGGRRFSDLNCCGCVTLIILLTAAFVCGGLFGVKP